MSATQSAYAGVDVIMTQEIEAVLSMFRSGLHESAMKGDGLVFVTTRDYEDGDQRIDIPRSMEKSFEFDELITRLNEPERQINVIVVMDCTRGMENPNKKIHIMFSLAWIAILSALRQMDTVKIICVFDPSEGGIVSSESCASIEEVNTFFSSVREGDIRGHHPPDETFLDELGGSVPGDSFIIVISDFLRRNGISAKCIFDIPARRNIRLMCAVLDGWKGFSPVKTLLSVVNASTGTLHTVDARPGKELDQLQDAARTQQLQFIEEAESLGHIAVTVPVLSERPFEELIRRLAPSL